MSTSYPEQPQPGAPWQGPPSYYGPLASNTNEPPKKKRYIGRWIALAVALLLLGSCTAMVIGGTKAINEDINNVPGTSDNGAASDVSVSKCTVETGFMIAKLKVTNSTDSAKDYLVTVSFESEGSQIGSGNGFVQALAAGQSSATDAGSLKAPPAGGDFTCRIAEVTRL